ncbi:SAM-dependent methyltransferase [Sorangium sp. So ce590]|uniref:SAM-dependent methyltransferase n=1 Tax=unclassified Sorangium TaxID=2621164 RepID=UPI003F5E3558
MLERAERLSRSLLWKLQRAYFERTGIDAWRKGQVPHYITSNPFVAASYARVVTGFLRDVSAARTLAPGEPLTIVELGAGSGRFAYHFLQKLLAEPRVPLLDGAPIRYVMTDVSPNNLAFWRAHPQLRPFFDAGVLDVALFDAERDEAIHLEIAGTELAPGSHARPLVAIANYVFDGLPQDAYRLKDGALFEARVTLSASGPLGDLSEPPPLDQIHAAYEHVPVTGEPDLDPDFRFLVEHYRDVFGEGAFQIPTASLACVRTLARLAGGGLLLLSADKGYCHEEELLDRSEPEIARHGSVSLLVDYHAIRRYIERAGGRALFPPQPSQSLCVGAFLIGAPAGGAETIAAFSDAVSGFGPDGWFSMKKSVEAAREAMNLRHLLAALALGEADGKLFLDVFDRLIELSSSTSGISGEERRVCFRLARRISELHYELGEGRDLAFHLGVWMRELGYLGEAIRYFEQSKALYGPSPETAYNLAYCPFGQQRCEEALRWIDAALAEAPDLPGGRALRVQIRAVARDEERPRGAARAAS